MLDVSNPKPETLVVLYKVVLPRKIGRLSLS